MRFRAKALTSPSCDKSPCSPCRISSGMPEWTVLATGSPSARASQRTVGRPSASPSGAVMEGAARQHAERIRACTWAVVCVPRKHVPVAMAAAARSSMGRSGPSPAITKRAAGIATCTSAIASINCRQPFFGTRRPTNKMTGSRFPGKPSPGVMVCKSMPIGRTRSLCAGKPRAFACKRIASETHRKSSASRQSCSLRAR